MAEPKQSSKERGSRFHLNLAGLKRGEERPSIAVTLLDRQGKSLHVSPVDAEGGFDLPEAALKETQRVVIGPSAPEGAPVDPDTLLRYRLSQFEQLLKDGALNIARPVWQKWFLFIECVTGTVKLCRPSPWWFQDLFQLATQVPAARLARTPPTASLKFETISRVSPAASVSELINFPFRRCQIICNGTVEVYRRTCCCHPWVIEDPRLPELIRELEQILRGIEQAQPFPRPDPNPPDPAPFVEALFFKGGALDEKALNAHTDLAALRSLPAAEIAGYVNARVYLRCFTTCGTPHKVAQGAINPDGRFNLCWFDWPRVHLANCHDEFAYVVKQRFGPFTFTVYDGVAANIWFGPSDDASLISYSPLAYACRNNGEPGDGAYVYLDVIGDTESWNLKTPDATAWDSVAAPAFNDGLVFPATLAAAAGANLNRNWGGTLKLNYKFSEDMKNAPVGAVYYRISVGTADSTGAAVGAPQPLTDGVSWEKSVSDGMGGVDIVPVVLGPFTVGTQNSLFKIPYDSDADWNADQYHGLLNTNDPGWSDPTVRHLVTVEVFDAAGTRLRPNGAPASGAPGAESASPFTFRRRFQDIGPTNPVPFAALTHMFRWDNRPLVAEIDYLNKDGLVFSEECLFLLGTAASTFGIGYRAYHEVEIFQLSHGISWQRGLGTFPGATGALLSSASNNVGQPPSLPGNSPTNTFAQMLRTDLDPTRKKCAFTVFLSISSKTTDGDNLGNGSLTRTAAFAIEID